MKHSGHGHHGAPDGAHGRPMKDPMVMMALEHYGLYRWVQAPIAAFSLDEIVAMVQLVRRKKREPLGVARVLAGPQPTGRHARAGADEA